MSNPGKYFSAFLILLILWACNKPRQNLPEPPPPPQNFSISYWYVHNRLSATTNYDIPVQPGIQLLFSAPVNKASFADNLHLKDPGGAIIPLNVSFSRADSFATITTRQPLKYLTKYQLSVGSLQSASGGKLTNPQTISLITSIDSSRKFPLISDDSLLTLVQKQTFKYFWDFAHPVSGLARERNTSGEVVTTGGSGFGIMAIVAAVERKFITRNAGLSRLQTIVDFLKNKAQKFHGAFPHWLNGTTGAVVPFSANDNGADLVETSLLLQGLLTARQYFNDPGPEETNLRNDINIIWKNVEWNWFRREDQHVLYWHWSPSVNWAMNLPIKGWNECLITYVLAASSPAYGIPKTVYDAGWASNGGMKNGNNYYGFPLPLGPALGGPLFFAHYSFLGINPKSLTDSYANYEVQNRNHALINYNYCVANPRQYFGYSDSCWGLTASDISNGYTASSPSNDVGVIAPTAALSSFPYTPAESMKALRFFYYVLGDKIWKEYGFVDAFSLHQQWFANSFLAIDQGPIIVMIENYRTGLLWNLFMSSPEIKSGMNKLGFSGPNL